MPLAFSTQSPQRRPLGTWNRHIAPDPSAAPQALQYVCQHRSAASQSKNSNADTRGCTQNTQMVTAPRFCQLLNVGNPRRTIKRVAHGVSAAPDHLRALRASAYICVDPYLAPRRHRSRDAGRDSGRIAIARQRAGGCRRHSIASALRRPQGVFHFSLRGLRTSAGSNGQPPPHNGAEPFSANSKIPGRSSPFSRAQSSAIS